MKISPLSPQSANQSILSSMAVIYGQSRPNMPSSSSRTLAHLISTSGSSEASFLPKRNVRLRNTLSTRNGAADLIRTIDALVRGSIIGGGGGGSEVNIGNGIRNGGNGYDVGETGDSGDIGMASNLSTSDSERNDIVGDTAVGNGCSLAGNTSSAGGRYYGYSGPESPSDFSSSLSSSSGSISGSESVIYLGDSAVGDIVAGSGCSSRPLCSSRPPSMRPMRPEPYIRPLPPRSPSPYISPFPPRRYYSTRLPRLPRYP
nr:hypothetical protein [Tanacetum cinerariifolium]